MLPRWLHLKLRFVHLNQVCSFKKLTRFSKCMLTKLNFVFRAVTRRCQIGKRRVLLVVASESEFSKLFLTTRVFVNLKNFRTLGLGAGNGRAVDREIQRESLLCPDYLKVQKQQQQRQQQYNFRLQKSSV